MTDSELEKAVEKISEDIDTLLKLKDKMIKAGLITVIETDKQGSIQVRLVKLQTEIQNKLAIALAFIAIAGAFVIAEGEQPPWSYQGIGFLIMALFFGICAFYSVYTTRSKIKEFNNVK